MPRSMHPRWTPLRLPLLCMLALPLAACSPEQLMAALTNRQPETVVGVCPSLPAPPDSAVTALDQDAARNPETAAWEIALAKHYDKLDACAGAGP